MQDQPRSTTGEQTALAILQEDHRMLTLLLQEYQLLAASSPSEADRQGLVSRLGAGLQALDRVMEEIVCPELRRMHGGAFAETLCSDRQAWKECLQAAAAADRGVEGMDAQMQGLGSLLQERMARDQSELFPMLAKVDSEALAHRVAMLRSEVMGQQGAD